ncbi:DUF4062 domain-containing protein, partial [Mesorhizobium sp. M7A.F.Ca.US.001.01.1.1]
MAKSDPSQVLAPSDKLSIFVSSTIGECAEERKRAAAGIRGTNHEPVVFEKLGARPYHPRDVYLSRLRQSHIAVAIYKDQYGYIDSTGGMTISGLEDEYRHARSWGLPILVYVQKDSTNRTLRLQALVTEIMASGITVAFYENPAELEMQIKDDVTALTTQRFFDADALSIALREKSEVLSAPPGGLILRADVIESLNEAMTKSKVVRLAGEAGSGKTTLLSQLAQAHGYKLVYGSRLSPKELFAVLANQLRGITADSAQQFATFEGAKHAFASAWAEAGEITVIIDDSPYIDDIADAMRSAGSAPDHRGRLLYSSRDLTALDSRPESIFHLEPMRPEQVGTMLNAAQREHTLEDVMRLWRSTGGNPLRIRQELVSSGRSTKQVWEELGPSQRELITYLSVSNAVLNVDDLLSLRDDPAYGSENLFADVDLVPELVVGTGMGFKIVHEAIREELWKLIASKPERIQFAAGRLGKFLESEGRVVEAYFVLAKAGHKNAGRLLHVAAFEAARSGDWKSSLPIQEELLKNAERRKDNDDIIHT